MRSRAQAALPGSSSDCSELRACGSAGGQESGADRLWGWRPGAAVAPRRHWVPFFYSRKLSCFIS